MNMTSEERRCRYCHCKEDGVTVFHCMKCKNIVHECCIRVGNPSQVHYDNYFDFECYFCSPKKEVINRQKLSWVKIAHLALCNMRQSQLGNMGFYELETDIQDFVRSNLLSFFPEMDPTATEEYQFLDFLKEALNSASCLFMNGRQVLKEEGWWRVKDDAGSPCFEPSHETKSAEFETSQNENSGSVDVSCITNNLSVYKETSESDGMSEENEDENQRSRKLPTINVSKYSLKKSENSFKKHAAKEESVPKQKPFDEMKVTKHAPSKRKRQMKKRPRKHFSNLLQVPFYLDSQEFQETLLITVGLESKERFKAVVSPYTGRELRPFIWQDFESKPPMLATLQQIRMKKHQSASNCDYSSTLSTDSIDYCYLKPHHVPTINCLCRKFFKQIENVIEYLEYPDYTVVALYKKLIIGFALMIPDHKKGENYISYFFVRPEWRNAGIGKFMLYNLMRMSNDKVVSLHVSVNSPALSIYDKCGFQNQYHIVNFFKENLNSEVATSPHAFYMKAFL